MRFNYKPNVAIFELLKEFLAYSKKAAKETVSEIKEMREGNKEAFLHSVYGKVVAAFIIGVVAIGAASLISKVGFNEMLQTVARLSSPNEKLRIVNNLFYRVTQLEQLQHVYAIENPDKPQEMYSPDVKRVMASVDSLRELCEHNPTQLARVDTMAMLLNQRQNLAQSYFKLRADLEKNRALNKQVITLSKQMATLEPKVENPTWKEKNKVVTTTRKTTTTSIIPPKTRKERRKEAAVARQEKGNFFQRLFSFGSSANKIKKNSREVKEDVHVKVDTFSVGREYQAYLKDDQKLRVVERELRVVERNYFQRSAALIAKELALVKASHQLNQQLLDILKTFEAEEVGQVKGDYFMATAVVNSSVERMNYITIVFFLGAALFAFLITLDISRANRLRLALQKAKDEAEHLSQVKQRFLANMSHELRTPLQSILGFSEQVKNQQNPDPEALDAIFYSSEHLLQIVNEVLDYSRIVSGKFTFEKKPFQVQQVAKEVIATLKPQAQKKGLELAINLDSKAPEFVSGDAFRLRQVLYNLVGNAIKFTDKGSVSLTVKCSQVSEKTLFSFKVKDSGIGIPEKDISRIFNQFEQSSGNDAQKHGGTGLGLSIAKSLVESQCGQLTVTSKLGEGSVFEIQIPYEVAEKQSGLVYHAVNPAEIAFQGDVMIVDDDAIILKLCAAIFEKHQVKTTCVRSSKEAAEMVLPANLKVVFTDIQMPDLNGFELCKALKKRLPQEVKVYALTARALPEEHADILNKGFDGILMKPFREQELLRVLNQLATSEISKRPETEDFDFGDLRSLCGKDEELFHSTLSLFVTEARAELDLLQIALKKDTPELALQVIHKLAGTIGQLGNSDLAEKLKKEEQKLKKAKSLKSLKTELLQSRVEVEKMVGLAQQKVDTSVEVKA